MTAYAAGAPLGWRALRAAVQLRPPAGSTATRTPVPRPRSAPPATAPVSDRPPSGAPQPPEHAESEVWPIVAAAQAGDPGAFAQLYDRYVDVVYRYVYFRLGDRSTAEELTSETFLRALRRITTLSNIGRDPGAWFVTIARNIVLDHVKSSRYRLEISTDDLPDTDPGPANGPEPVVLQRLTNRALLDCVRKLGADQQECIALRFLHGLSVAETAAAMGRNEGAIKALQHRAVRRLARLVPAELR